MNLLELWASGCDLLGMRAAAKSNLRAANSKYELRTSRKTVRRLFFAGDHAPQHVAIATLVQRHRGDNFALYCALRKSAVLMMLIPRIVPEALVAAIIKRSMDSKNWVPPVWVDQLLSPGNNPYLCALHSAHVSVDDPAKLAYTPDEKHLLADRQVRIKPGRYLMKFFGPESDNPQLTEAECKHWADRWAAARVPTVLAFVPNTDPDGWVWAYENSPDSCMRYNRSGRHLVIGAHGAMHPVRAYAHPDNDLALAYIMVPGEIEDRSFSSDCGYYVISARTIVNTARKTWLRVYAEDDRERVKIVTLLTEAGYTQDADTTLARQKLQRMCIDDDSDAILCPYLDGGITNFDDYGDYLRISERGVYSGTNANGVCTLEPPCTCPRCGEGCSDDDMIYVESRGESVCDSCINADYVCAIVNHKRNSEYELAEDCVEVGGEWYLTNILCEFDIYECAKSGDYYHIDDMVSLENGDLVHCARAFCDEVDSEYYLLEDVVHSVDGSITNDNAVQTYPDGESAHENRCFTLFVGKKRVYVHRDTMNSPQFSELFVQCGSLLLTSDYYGYPVRSDFVPTNVKNPEDAQNHIEDIIAEHGAGVEHPLEQQLAA